jgi:methyl-accepting chemotaxis protein
MSRIRSISIGKRLAFAFGLLTIGLALVALVGLQGAGSLSDDGQREQALAGSLVDLDDLNTATDTTATDVVRHLYVYDGDAATEDRLAREIAALRPQAAKAFERAAKVHADNQDLLKQIRDGRSAFNAAVASAVTASREETARKADNRDGSRNQYLEKVLPAETRLRTALHALRSNAEDDLAASRSEARATVTSVKRTVLIVGLLAVLAAAALALLITRSITRPVAALLERVGVLRDKTLPELGGSLEAMAAGDFTREVDTSVELLSVDGKDELSELGTAVNAMLEQTRAATVAYDGTRNELRGALGDQSCLTDLTARLDSLSSNCLTHLEQGLKAMSAGDLTITVEAVTTPLETAPGQSLGELGEIFNGMLSGAQSALVSYNATRDKLEGMLREISAASSQVAGSSQEVASTSEEAGRAISEIANAVSDVAQGAERQVRTVASAHQMTEEMTQATRVGTDNANQTTAATDRARDVAEQGVEAVVRATEAMEAARESSTQVTAAIRSLGAKSEQIGGIVATITGIAEQTNLLALNAAIEAARAGEQGRGFAVVAEEVRKLAEESQEAAASIGGLIREIQEETTRTVTAVETGTQRTTDGAQTVEQAHASFLEIRTSVDDVSDRVNQIAAVMTQIAESSQRMQQDMAEVSAVAEQSSASSEEVSASTEQTSASTQEIASSAQRLAGTAEELDRLVGQFTLA